jgi:hypothetical protein
MKTKRMKRGRKGTRRNTRKIQVGCSKTKKFRGGKGMAEFSPMTLPKVPNALIGPPWLPSAPSLANSNHFSQNMYNKDIVTTMQNPGSQLNYDSRWGKMWGGKSKKLKSRKLKGRKLKGGSIAGKIIPSDILNAGRYLGYNAQNTWNGYFGYPSAVNPLPWVQPYIK